MTPNGDGADGRRHDPVHRLRAVGRHRDGHRARRQRGPHADASRPSTRDVLGWDGRTASGKAVPDGRYTIAIAARDAAGNVGAGGTGRRSTSTRPSPASPARRRCSIPQDGDAARPHARRSTLPPPGPREGHDPGRRRGRCRGPHGVRDRTTRRGDVAWSWNGKVDGGAYARPGDLPDRRLGDERPAARDPGLSVTVRGVPASACRVPPDASAARRLTITARSAEPLADDPGPRRPRAGCRRRGRSR